MDLSAHANQVKLVRAEGLEPSRPCEQRIFLPLRLSPPSFEKRPKDAFVKVWGLDYPFTMPRSSGA